LFILPLFGCAPLEQAEPVTQVDTNEADTAAINQVAESWADAFKAADAAALASLYTADSVLMPPNEEAVKGREAEQVWNQQLFDQFSVEQAELSTDELVVSGDWAFRVGSFEMTMTTAEGISVEDSGKFIEIWRRQADGSWRIAYDIWNSNLPLPEATE
jgi:uncharacterized protein (TIGR02246 family)